MKIKFSIPNIGISLFAVMTVLLLFGVNEPLPWLLGLAIVGCLLWQWQIVVVSGESVTSLYPLRLRRRTIRFADIQKIETSTEVNELRTRGITISYSYLKASVCASNGTCIDLSSNSVENLETIINALPLSEQNRTAYSKNLGEQAQYSFVRMGDLLIWINQLLLLLASYEIAGLHPYLAVAVGVVLTLRMMVQQIRYGTRVCVKDVLVVRANSAIRVIISFIIIVAIVVTIVRMCELL